MDTAIGIKEDAFRWWLRVLLTTAAVLAAVSFSSIARAQTCIDPPSGMVGWWTGDGDGSDLIGVNDLTGGSAPVFAPGMVGQAFQFTVNTALPQIYPGVILKTPGDPASLASAISDEMTMVAWFKTVPGALTLHQPGFSVGWPIVSKGSGIGPNNYPDDSYSMGVRGDQTRVTGDGKFSCAFVGVTGQNDVSGATVVNDGAWHLGACTYDANEIFARAFCLNPPCDGFVRTYVDGALDSITDGFNQRVTGEIFDDMITSLVGPPDDPFSPNYNEIDPQPAFEGSGPVLGCDTFVGPFDGPNNNCFTYGSDFQPTPLFVGSGRRLIDYNNPPGFVDDIDFAGYVDEVMIFNRKLTDAEIQAIYDAGSAGVGKGDSDGDGVSDCRDNCPYNANGPAESNPGQEDSDGDGIGDKCDLDTINPSFAFASLLSGPGAGAFHATTPLYRSRVEFDTGCLSFGAGHGIGVGGVFDPGRLDPDIGLDAGSDTNLVKICPATLDTGAISAIDHSWLLMQSTWQSLLGDASLPSARMHVGSGGNGVGIGYEIGNEAMGGLAVITGDVVATWSLTLPPDYGIFDSSGASAIGLPAFKGKLTIKDSSGNPVHRFSTVGGTTNGKRSAIMDDCPGPVDTSFVTDANTAADDVIGFHRLIQELDNTLNPSSPASCGPAAAKIGINHDDGQTAMNIKLRQEGFENQADTDTCLWRVAGMPPNLTIIATCPLAFVDRNRGISTRMGLGWELSSLTSSALPAGLSTIHGRHGVGFNEETDINWPGVTIKMHNEGPKRFNQAPGEADPGTDYALLPNNGGTCAVNDCAQVHTGLGFSGQVDLGGSSRIEFVNGGAGVAVSDGQTVVAGDPCLSADPINDVAKAGRCAENFRKRGVFTFENLTITGGPCDNPSDTDCGPMSGLGCSNSDCSGNSLTVDLGNDPNVTDKNLNSGRGAVGCGGSLGIRIGWNPLTNEYIANVPLDTGACAATVNGICIPAYKPGAGFPSGTGICNLAVNQVVATAQSNPLKLSGGGLGCSQDFGQCNIGNVRVTATGDGCEQARASFTSPYPFVNSKISGFAQGVAIGGPANVDPATGVPLRHDSLRAVPPLVACLKNISVTDSEVAVGTGGNSTTFIDGAHLDRCEYNCLVTGAGGATIATPANSGCPTDDGIHCKDRGREYFAPLTGGRDDGAGGVMGDEDHLAAISGGISAPTKLTVKNSCIACPGTVQPDGTITCPTPADCQCFNECTAPECVADCTDPGESRICFNAATAGREPVLPGLGPVDTWTEDALGNLIPECDSTSPNKDLTFFGVKACGLKTGLAWSFGADMLLHPELFAFELPNNTICVSSPFAWYDNRNYGNGPVPNFSAAGSCILKKDGTCITASTPGEVVVASTVPAGSATTLNAAVEAQASSAIPLDVGLDGNGDGIPDTLKASLPTLPPGTNLNTCSGQMSLAKTVLGDPQSQLKAGIKTAGTQLLTMAQNSGTTNATKCSQMIHAARRVTENKILDSSNALTLTDALDEAGLLCCGAN